MSEPAAARAETGLAIAALVLGVLALTLSPVLVGVPLAIAGLVVALAGARQRTTARGMLRWGAGLSIAGLLAGAAFAALYYHLYTEWRAEFARYEDAEEEVDVEWVGVRAPEMRFSTLDGEAVDLAQFAGRPVVITFWATWCAPCRAEIPHLERLAREVPEIAVLGLSEEPEATLREFTAKTPIAYRIASVPTPPAPFDSVRSVPTSVFIDRKGVVREVRVGMQEFDELRTRALGPEFAGTARSARRIAAPVAGGVATERWTAPVAGTLAMATCNWDADPAPEVLVLDGGNVLHVLDAAGREKAKVTLPERFARLECARAADGTVRLLGYVGWGRSVTVMDATGRASWSYPAPTGINGAHWGDLDGDGDPEMIVGLNGDGGLHAVSSKGHQLWKVTTIGNVWHQAVLPAVPGREALVAATEAGGTVRVFDGEGSQVAQLQPEGDYYTAVATAETGTGAAQTAHIIATGRKRVVAFDPEGKVAWQLPFKVYEQGPVFAQGDLAGDGTTEWVFPSRTRKLIVVSATGASIAEIERKAGAAFAVLAAPGAHGILVLADGDVVRAYSIEPPPS